MSVPGLPKAEGDFRFFEPGNHFSENVYVAKCTADEVDDHLPMFEKYLDAYVDMLNTAMLCRKRLARLQRLRQVHDEVRPSCWIPLQ